MTYHKSFNYNQIYNGNGIELIKNLQNNSVHSIISDIPYGISYDDWDVLHNNSNSALGGSSKSQNKSALFKRRGKPLNGWSAADKKIAYEYQEWVNSWCNEWFRVLMPGSSVFIFAGRQYSHRVICAFEDSGFTFKDMLSWERDKAPHRAQRVSKIYERRGDIENQEIWDGWRLANLRPLFEPILWFQKPYKIGGTLADNIIEYNVGGWNEAALDHYNLNKGIKNQSNMIRVEVNSEDRGMHSTQKPLNLMKLLVELVTTENQLVLDPFAGSGTTVMAAMQLNRMGLGFEIDKDMCISANKRINNFSY